MDRTPARATVPAPRRRPSQPAAAGPRPRAEVAATMPTTTSASSRRFAEQAEEATRIPARLRRCITRLTGLTVSGQILVVVGVAFWCIGRYAGGRPLYMLAYGVLAVVVVSKVLTRRAPPVQG